MNKEIDELLCLLDGKITAYRFKHPYVNNDDMGYLRLIAIQKEIQELWQINKGG